MRAVVDPLTPSSSAELRVIKRLSSGLRGATAAMEGSEAGKLRPPSAGFRRPAPSRDDVPLLDPCCGLLSAGAEVDLGIKGRPRFIDFHHVPSALWVPPKTPQSCMGSNLSEEQARGFRKVPDAAIRATLIASPAAVKMQPRSPRTRAEALMQSSFPDKHGRAQGVTSSDPRMQTDTLEAVRHFTYKSATQRSFEDIGWESKLRWRHKAAPAPQPERKADPVSERPSLRRYHSQPQLWQSFGGEWNRKQLRLTYAAKKPISFCSGCRRTGQIPLYTGSVGSENIDNIDNMDEDFQTLTLKRSIVPPYTPTAHRNTIPGYAGRAAHAVSATAHSLARSREVEGSSRASGRTAPLSRMLTTTAPRNPFLRPTVSRTTAQGDVRQRR